jgi:undecaprenyl diphosphate synthase
MQSLIPLQSDIDCPLHVAIIMDGNGRWARRRGLPRGAGHRAGVDAIRRTLEAAPSAGIATLTLFAFSSDNWRRPAEEVGLLMGLLRRYLRRETKTLAVQGIRLEVIGRRDRLPDGLAQDITAAERFTAAGERLRLRIAVDYSSRDAILAAANSAVQTREAFAARLGASGSPDVDLVIRTGGEKRLSDFLLWESAYAELHFTELMWPDFDAAALALALADFRRRDRRFGALAPALTDPVAA